jgi:hypothetical protein
MAELKNTFSWSFSAAEDFEECRRKRYWSKYAAWNGWAERAPERARTAYRLNKMESRFSLQGRAVEMAVLWVLREGQAGRRVSADEAYQQIARPYLNKRWKESRDKVWRANPKAHCCLHEHYYPDLHQTPEKEWTAALSERVTRCIVHFIEKVLPRLEHVRPEQEVAIATPGQGGDPEYVEWNGVKIYAIPDYVYRVDEQWHIHDWKTGKPKIEHKDQLAIYGLWAHLKHGVAPERITVYLEYLNEGIVAGEALTAGRLEEVRAFIRNSIADMSDYLEDGDLKRNAPLPQPDWDLAPTRGPCRTCNFYELCRPEFDME